MPSASPGGSPGVAGGAIAGDSNGDGIFNSADLVLVLQIGEFEDGILGNSTFEEGDWDGDGDFTTHDFVFAFQQGSYVAEARPRRPDRTIFVCWQDPAELRRRQRVLAATVGDFPTEREIEFGKITKT